MFLVNRGHTMKKLLLCLFVVVELISITIVPVTSTILINKDPTVILIDDFNIYSLADFMKETAHLKSKDVLKIISIGPGGDAFILMSMVNHIEALQTRGIKVVTETQAIACSANAFIWLAGDERVVHRHDLIMFHPAYTMDRYGNKQKMEDLPPEQQMIIKHINTYMRFKLTKILRNTGIVNDMLKDSDNWYTGLELFKSGVATKLIEN